MKSKNKMKLGCRVIITGNHPWCEEVGTFKGEKETPFGLKLLIELDNGVECFAKQFQVKEI